MRSPSDMQTIQIDITNACNKKCSNCTRFCGNHEKTFFMDFETFQRAVNSLKGYDGVIGVMGGEPTLHPQFERFARYLHETYQSWQKEGVAPSPLSDRTDEKTNRLHYPQKEFIKEIHRREFDTHHIRKHSDGHNNFMMSGPGLWSNMGDTYRKYYELIQDMFPVQFLNDHINASFHQPGLFSRKDLGMSDEEWFQRRDQCWIQNEWSATVTPKGAFFCEIAGALDMLFDGPGGWKIEEGWWKRKPQDFTDQLHWCEICGFALHTFMRDANDEIDDVSPTLYEMLKKTNSPRFKAGRVNQVEIHDGVIDERSKATGQHFSVAQPYIEHYEDRFNESNSHLFIHEYDVCEPIQPSDGFGVAFNRCLEKAKDWILYITDGKLLPEIQTVKDSVDALIKGYILNPGTLHLGEGYVFFSKQALSLKSFGFDRVARAGSFEDIIKAWDASKVVNLSEVEELARWNREKIIPGKRYVIWGAGFSGAFFADAVLKSDAELVLAIDNDSCKDGKIFYGATTHLPAYLNGQVDNYDYLLIAHYSRFEEIREQALSVGVPQEKIIMPYEV